MHKRPFFFWDLSALLVYYALQNLGVILLAYFIGAIACRCAMGNCYSLQKDHETALKNFQRAVHLDARFAYAHTLCGHEYGSTLLSLSEV